MERFAGERKLHSCQETLCRPDYQPEKSKHSTFRGPTSLTPVHCARVLFTDESRFNLSIADGRVRVFRRRGERFAYNCLLERDKFGGGSVMIWAGIMGGRKTDLVVIPGNLNAQGYIDKVLRPVVVPFLCQNSGMLMHDNARPHTARVTANYLARMALMCYHGQRVLQT
jgi:hypothetical protein